MADVFVVSMFMTYIGFNGVIASQLGNISSVEVGDYSTQDMVILATNGTTLQPGFYTFLAYVLLSMIFSGYLKRTNKSLNIDVDEESLTKSTKVSRITIQPGHIVHRPLSRETEH